MLTARVRCLTTSLGHEPATLYAQPPCVAECPEPS